MIIVLVRPTLLQQRDTLYPIFATQRQNTAISNKKLSISCSSHPNTMNYTRERSNLDTSAPNSLRDWRIAVPVSQLLPPLSR
jgi:hypothetical protein